MPYYGLYIPVKGGATSTNGANSTNASTLADTTNGGDANKDNNETDVSAFVFQNKKDALVVLKQHKDARFKEFLNEDDAIKYAQTGFEIVQNKYNDVKTSTESLEKAAFRAPTKQQLIRFRQIIEEDDWILVKKMIWDNPRYLVSSGDTPTILKEGYRYNAMHVCAITQCPNVAKLILDTVSDPKFADLLMGKKNDEKSCKELCANLLDYYLNIPEKGRNETPLHLASKFGWPSMVEILTSYPECKMLKNSQGLTPRFIICDRGKRDNYAKIEELFEERYYVPVLRCNDSSIPAQIGEPFSASNPPTLNCDPLTPEVEIKALAGPMSAEKAKQFFRRWKTPPRLGSNVSSPLANNPFISPMKARNSTPIKTPRASNTSFNSPTASLQRRSLFNSTPQRKEHNGVIDSNGFDKSILDDSFDDKQNGNHENGRHEMLSSDKLEEANNNNNHLVKMPKPQMNMLKSALCPRTPMFKHKNNAFSTYREQNFASPMVGTIEVTQQINDSLLNVSDIYDSPGFKERHVKNTDAEKGIECIGRVLAKQQNVEWREYWDFLEELIDIASEKGIQKLENYLAQRQGEQDERNNRTQNTKKADILDDVCSALENCFRNSNTAAPAVTTTTTHQSTTPYTYVEKSLQVHARRMTKTIIHNIDNEVSIIDALLLELRRVKSLIYSFKEDASYVNVNFEKVHSRIGNLVSMFLENSQEVSKQMKEKILIILQNLSQAQGERREHMECVCSHIFHMLQHPTEQILPENVKTEDMCSKIWSQEKNCDCQWESNLSRKTSRRNRMEARYKNHQRLKQQEKVQKDVDNPMEPNKDEWRNTTAAASLNESSDDDEFWSDFGGSDTEEDEVFLTPCESPSRLSLSDDTDDDSNKIFIYGNEPTKRDLDVLNAIFHITIDKTKYPNIHSWKSTIMRYPNEEKDYFPSPRIVKKSHSFVQPQTPTSMQKTYSIIRSNTSSSILHSPRSQTSLVTTTSASLSASSGSGAGGGGLIKEAILQLPTAKRLFMSPGRPKSMTANSLANNTNSNVTTAATATTATITTTATSATMKWPMQQHFQTQRPITPLNKLRGLFSAYRESQDSSPLSSSSTSP